MTCDLFTSYLGRLGSWKFTETGFSKTSALLSNLIASCEINALGSLGVDFKAVWGNEPRLLTTQEIPGPQDHPRVVSDEGFLRFPAHALHFIGTGSI